jgi:hypothetical protein
MTTEEAFKKIIYKSDFHEKTGLSHSRITNYRRYLEGNTSVSNRRPTMEQMEKLLLKYGAKVIHEKMWKI